MSSFYVHIDATVAPRRIVVTDRETRFERRLSIQDTRALGQRLTEAAREAERRDTETA